VFVAENYQYKPLLRRVRGLIADGLIGAPLFIHINAIKRQRDENNWRADPALALGGALYEGGIHWIDFMASLGLPIRAVHGVQPQPASSVESPGSTGARSAADAAPRTIERSMQVSFAYENGPAGLLSYSWEVPSTAKGLRLSKIYGRAGTITFETNGLWVLLHGKKTRIYVPGLRDLAGYGAMWADFVQAWKTGREPAMTLAQARRDLELVEQAYATAGVT
jgi:predicted dehydrogenase